MKKNSLQSYKVQYRLKAELKTTNQKPLSPLRMSSLVVVHCMYKNWIVPIIRKFGGSDLGLVTGVIFCSEWRKWQNRNSRTYWLLEVKSCQLK